MKTSGYHYGHPYSCRCGICVANRASARKQRLKRIRKRISRGGSFLLIVVTAFVLVSAAALTLIHVFHGAKGEMLSMVYKDIRVAMTCPGKPAGFWRFLNRPTGFNWTTDQAVRAVCEDNSLR